MEKPEAKPAAKAEPAKEPPPIFEDDDLEESEDELNDLGEQLRRLEAKLDAGLNRTVEERREAGDERPKKAVGEEIKREDPVFGKLASMIERVEKVDPPDPGWHETRERDGAGQARRDRWRDSWRRDPGLVVVSLVFGALLAWLLFKFGWWLCTGRFTPRMAAWVAVGVGYGVALGRWPGRVGALTILLLLGAWALGAAAFVPWVAWHLWLSLPLIVKVALALVLVVQVTWAGWGWYRYGRSRWKPWRADRGGGGAPPEGPRKPA